MTAGVGDRLVVASSRTARPVRTGEVLRTGPAGGPPYRVRWDDTGQETTFVPGPGVRTEHAGADRQVPAAVPRHVDRLFTVDVHVVEEDGETTAEAVLHGDGPRTVRSHGSARRNPADPEVPEVGAETAAAHALHRLGDHLLGLAAQRLARPSDDGGRHEPAGPDAVSNERRPPAD